MINNGNKSKQKDITNFQTSPRCREIWRNGIRFDIERSGKIEQRFHESQTATSKECGVTYKDKVRKI